MSTDISNNLSIDIDDEFKFGDKVEVNWKGKGKWLPGKISKIDQNRGLSFIIDYDDGKREYNVKLNLIRRPDSTTKKTDNIYNNLQLEIDHKTLTENTTKQQTNTNTDFKINKTDKSVLENEAGLFDNLNDSKTNMKICQNLDKEDFFGQQNDLNNKRDNINKYVSSDSKFMAKNGVSMHRIIDPNIDGVMKEFRTYNGSDSDSGDECNNIKTYLQQLINENEVAEIYKTNNNKLSVIKISGNETISGDEDSNSNESKFTENDNVIKIQTNKELINNINPNITKTELIGILSKIEIDWHDIDYIKKFINETFSSNLVSLCSTHLDIISSYLNSQKSIYTESSYYTSTWLNCLMIPTIIISAGASVISGADEMVPHAQLIISCITAFSAFLLSVINYLKLDAASEAHKISAHQYDKLQSHIMFFSGKSLLFSQAAFNSYTRSERENKRTLEKKQQVRNMIKEQQEKNLKDLEILKENYKKEKKELEIELNDIQEKLNEFQSESDLLLNNKNSINIDTFNTRQGEINTLRTKIGVERDRIEKELVHSNEEFKQARIEGKDKIKKFMNDFKVLRNKVLDEGTIELNNEDTAQQQKLMIKILEEIDDVQKKIKEIKETNKFEVPRTIRNRYPKAYNINVFSLIKMIEDYKVILTIKLWICRNNLRQYRSWVNYCSDILATGKLNNKSKIMVEEQIEKFNKVKLKCAEKKNTIYESFVALSVSYIEIDAILEDELKLGELKKSFGCFYHICPCIIKLFHDSSWVENSFINHIYESSSKNVKKLQGIDKINKSKKWIGKNFDDDDDELMGDLMV